MDNFPEKYKGSWGRKQAAHLTRRTMFGAKKEDVDHFTSVGINAAVDELLKTDATLPFLPLNNYDQFGTYVPPGKTWIGSKYVKEEDDGRMISFQLWSAAMFIQQERSIREKMTLFWHNHFATDTAMGHSEMVWKHHSMLRENATGNFKTLVMKVTTDPHMLRYLNGEYNAKGAPDENYARELQELFCTGKDSNRQYTEEDIKQAAKVLTGWKVNYETGESFFDPETHDTGDKHFSSYYNLKIIKGKEGAEGGREELEQLIDMILSVKESALFICRKIYRWFVNSSIGKDAETGLIEPLADLMIKNNFEIKPVLRSLFTSAHFYDESLYGAQIKNPIDFCIGLQREFNLKYLEPEKYVLNYSMWLHTVINYSELGMAYAYPPNVAGWPALYQSPAYYQLWINGALYPKRNEYSSSLIRFGYNREGHLFRPDPAAFAETLKEPGNPDRLIDEVLEVLLSVKISEPARQKMKKDFLLTGQEADHYWTDAWNDYLQHKEDADKKNIVETRLSELYAFITSSPEYQLM